MRMVLAPASNTRSCVASSGSQDAACVQRWCARWISSASTFSSTCAVAGFKPQLRIAALRKYPVRTECVCHAQPRPGMFFPQMNASDKWARAHVESSKTSLNLHNRLRHKALRAGNKQAHLGVQLLSHSCDRPSQSRYEAKVAYTVDLHINPHIAHQSAHRPESATKRPHKSHSARRWRLKKLWLPSSVCRSACALA